MKPLHAQSSNGQLVESFLRNYSAEITSNPNQSYAAFADYVGSRDELLFSAREILSRQEWKEVLAGEDGKQSLRKIQSDQLISWIERSLSEQNSQPWIDAIVSIASGSLPDVSGEKGTSSPFNHFCAQVPFRFWAILIVTASLTAGLLVTLKQCTRQDRFNTKTSEKNSSSLLRDRPRLTNRDDPQSNLKLRSGEQVPNDIVNEDSQAVQNFNDSSKRASNKEHTPSRQVQKIFEEESPIRSKELRSPQESPPKFDSPQGSSNQISIQALLRKIENGTIEPDRILLAEALNVAPHWVQQISTMGGASSTYQLRLRSNAPISRFECEQMTTAYKNSYQKPGVGLAVVVESRRYKQAGLSQGFLPVCRASVGNRFEYVKYN